MKMSFTWTKSPDELGKNVARFGKKFQGKLVNAVEGTGVEAAGEMKRARPWRDITGNARRGLRCEVATRDSMITLYFIHSVEYGVNLELGHAGRYAVIVPTMHRTIPRLQRRLRGAVK